MSLPMSLLDQFLIIDFSSPWSLIFLIFEYLVIFYWMSDVVIYIMLSVGVFSINTFELCSWMQLHYLGIAWSLQPTLFVGQDWSVAQPRAWYSHYWYRELLYTLPGSLSGEQRGFRSDGRYSWPSFRGPCTLIFLVLLSGSFQYLGEFPHTHELNVSRASADLWLFVSEPLSLVFSLENCTCFDFPQFSAPSPQFRESFRFCLDLSLGTPAWKLSKDSDLVWL